MTGYRDAGVDVEAGYEAVRRIKGHAQKTLGPEVISGVGGFGGLFALDNKKYRKPVLVSGTDGVGTKLKLAFMTGRHDTIGIDCVAMCVNDIVCTGAQPLFFLDYLALGKNRPEKVEQIVKGVSDGCIMAGCSLLGGETAEMPGFYPEDEYDLAGFAVGIVEKEKIIDGKGIEPGDALVGLPSSGLHSNGFSLVRKLLAQSREQILEYNNMLGTTVADELLKPTRIYVKTVLDLAGKFNIKGIANITGGGFVENIPRILPEGINAEISCGSWPVHTIFRLLQQTGNIEKREMFNTFNMGIGIVLAVEKKAAHSIVKHLESNDEKAYLIGETASGKEGIKLC